MAVRAPEDKRFRRARGAPGWSPPAIAPGRMAAGFPSRAAGGRRHRRRSARAERESGDARLPRAPRPRDRQPPPGNRRTGRAVRGRARTARACRRPLASGASGCSSSRGWPTPRSAACCPRPSEVRLVEREPMAGFGRLGGRLYLVDERGAVIDDYGPRYADLDLPVIRRPRADTEPGRRRWPRGCSGPSRRTRRWPRGCPRSTWRTRATPS